MTRGPSARLAEILLAAGSLLFVLVCLEGGLRLKSWFADRRGFAAAMKAARAPRPRAHATLGQIIRPSPDHRIVYELWPDLDVVFDTQTGIQSELRTNSEGFRSAECPVEKAGRRLRIAGIGDSLMFGWGVGQDAPYLAVLERLLNRSSPGVRWEVINTAVPGYNAVMEVETLKTKVLKYRPDVVIYGFCPNDASLPNFIQRLRNPLSLRESFLWDFVDTRLHPRLESDDALVAAPRRGDDRAFEDDPSRAPEAYRDLTGWGAFGRALGELKDLGTVNGFRTIVVALAPGRDDPRKERGLRRAAELGLSIVDVGRAQEAFMRAHEIGEYAGSVLTLSASDLHPSPLSHEMVAGELLRALTDEGLAAPGPRVQ